MPNQFIAGNDLSDLSRNSLAAAQQDQDARQATAQLLLNQFIARAADRNRGDDRQLAREDQDKRYGYLGNQLASNERLSANDLAMRRDAMMLPYNQETKADAERNALLQRELQIREAQAKNNPFSGVNPALMNDYFHHTESDEKAQRMADAAAEGMNQFTLGKINALAQPILKGRIDKGTDNPGWHLGGSGVLFSSDADAAASGVDGTSIMPDNMADHPAVVGTKNWWENPSNPVKSQLADIAARQSLAEHPDAAALVTWDTQKKRFAARPQATPFMGGMQIGQAQAATPPSVGGGFGNYFSGLPQTNNPIQNLPARIGGPPVDMNSARDNLVPNQTQVARGAELIQQLGGRVLVADSTGRRFTIPAAQLPQALQQGYKPIQ